jgi:tetratricopeptide (TPR) repeat protein
VGGGATGIEYVERGSHQERNVLLHEYAHLFHGNVLTDGESRRIRALYHAAMEGGRTLDYYASNNESEFLAQAFEAYVMPAKVHPLNHKSMNTVHDLRTRDPALFAFIDSMAVRQRAFLAGDSLALRSNWAHVYVALARRAYGENAQNGAANGAARAFAALDTALLWDERYVPAYTARANVLAAEGDFAGAEAWLARAEAIDPRHAPIQVARAAVVAARQGAGLLSEGEALTQRTALLQRALALEEDLAERATLNASLRTMLADHARIPDAIRVAESYAETAPTISTYLRDRRDEARAFTLALRAAVGYATEAADSLAALVARKPFNYQHRAQYADALEAAGRTADAYRVLEEAQRVLRAAGQPRIDYTVRMASLLLAESRPDSARALIEPVLSRLRGFDGDVRMIGVLAGSGAREQAARLLAGDGAQATPVARADRAHALALLRMAEGDSAAAETALRSAVQENPYDAGARLALVRLLASTARAAEARAFIEPAGLELPLGPDFRRRAEAAVR